MIVTRKIIHFAIAVSLLVAYGSAIAQDWTKTSSINMYAGTVASSTDGNNVVAAQFIPRQMQVRLGRCVLHPIRIGFLLPHRVTEKFCWLLPMAIFFIYPQIRERFGHLHLGLTIGANCLIS